MAGPMLAGLMVLALVSLSFVPFNTGAGLVVVAAIVSWVTRQIVAGFKQETEGKPPRSTTRAALTAFAATVILGSIAAVADRHPDSPLPVVPEAQVIAQRTAEIQQKYASEQLAAFNADRPAIVKAMREAIAKKDWDAASHLNDKWMPIVTDKEWNELGAKVKMHELQIEHVRTAAAEKADRARRKHEGVHIGMTQREVTESSWGFPEHVNKTIYSFGTHEQWVYPGSQYLYFENGVLTSIQTH
jgi:hypothetical protein